MRAELNIYSDQFNKRIRVDDYVGFLEEVEGVIQDSLDGWVEKLIVKSRINDVPFFLTRGYHCEAFIPQYFGGEGMYFMTRYFKLDRSISLKYIEQQQILSEIIRDSKRKAEADPIRSHPLGVHDAEEVSALFARYFPTYPTPMHLDSYVAKTMFNGTLYRGIRMENQIVSIASAEINETHINAELTDCLTLPEYRGRRLMENILIDLEKDLKGRGINQLYTIARAQYKGINRVFYNLGYFFGGCLINNCFIGQGLEDMNVWYKIPS